MSMENLNTYCLSLLLKYLSENDILTFCQAYPEHEQTAKSYWLRRRKLDVDELVFHKSDVLLQIVALCENITVLKLNEKRIGVDFKELPATISRHCQELQVLDIRGIELTDADLIELSRLTSLKSLSINFHGMDYNLGKLFRNNSALESVSICDYRQQMTGIGSSLNELPDSIKNIELNKCHILNMRILLNCLKNWKLKSLRIPGYCITSIYAIEFMNCSALQSMQSMQIYCHEDEPFLGDILKSTPELVELNVAIYPMFGRRDHYLKHLPKTLKTFILFGVVIDDITTFFESIRHLDLENLSLNNILFRNELRHYDFIARLVKAAPNLSSLSLSLNCSTRTGAFGELKKLKFLRLVARNTNDINSTLEIIADDCQQLEVLVLEQIDHIKLSGFESIAKLLKLKELRLIGGSDYFSSSSLRRCQHLETIEIAEFPGFTNGDASALIQQCKSLKCLEIFECGTSEALLEVVINELQIQKERKNVLKLTVDETDFPKEFIRDTTLHHPLLQLRGFLDRKSYIRELMEFFF